MSTSRSEQKRIAHKRTPTASWKDDLRRACLDRARQRRGQQRRSSEQGITIPDDPHIIDSPNDEESDYYNERTSARELIQQELNQYRLITVLTPGPPERGRTNTRNALNENDAQTFTEHQDDEYHQHYSMTEEEWIELIQEVEEEMERAEAIQLEQVLELERHEEQYWQEQISEFDDHEYNDDDGAYYGTQVKVVCPICHEANLTESAQGDVVCPNHMDGSCSLLLSPRNGLTRQSLCHALSLAYQEHARYCNGNLFFEMKYGMGDCGPDHLNAVCSGCQSVQQVV